MSDDPTKYCPNRQCPFLARHGEPAEYEVEMGQCLDCDAPLQWGPPPEGFGAPGPMTEQAGTVTDTAIVAAFPSQPEAETARLLLETSGIAATVVPVGAHASGVFGGALPASFRLRVAESDLERARKALEGHFGLREAEGDGGAPDPDDPFWDEIPDGNGGVEQE